MSEKYILNECCEYPMKVCDETVGDFEISHDSRVSINIYHAHQKVLENYYRNELDLPDDVLNATNDMTIPIYKTRTINKYAKPIDLLYVIDIENNKEHCV